MSEDFPRTLFCANYIQRSLPIIFRQLHPTDNDLQHILEIQTRADSIAKIMDIASLLGVFLYNAKTTIQYLQISMHTKHLFSVEKMM